MAATITFHANGTDGIETLIAHQATTPSGIGFYGDGFGQSVSIGTSQNTTFITDGTGTVSTGRQLRNTKFTTSLSAGPNDPGLVAAGDGPQTMQLHYLPNQWCPLNIRFENDTAVSTINPKIIIFDRNSIENHAVGVDTMVYEARHPLTSYTVPRLQHISVETKAQANQWFEFDSGDTGAPDPLTLTASPGPSGLNTSASDTSIDSLLTSNGLILADYKKGATGTFTRHDWYVALSAIPQSIGAKRQYALYFSVEYVG
jgi:hypothetical protein